MKQAILVMALSMAAFSGAIGASLPDDLVRELSDTIRKRCPEAKIEITEDTFIAKDGTMIFTLHGRSKTGEIFPQTHQEEGPNFKGFILRIAIHHGKYRGAAVVPNTLQGPYFRTFIDAPGTDDGKKYYEVHFSFGDRVDPQLKEAIFEALPKTRFHQHEQGETLKRRMHSVAADKTPLIPVSVHAQAELSDFKACSSLPMSVTLTNRLSNTIRFITFATVPNEWNGETFNITLVEVRRGEKGYVGFWSPLMTL